jgi:uncharacterized protein with GYD domain
MITRPPHPKRSFSLFVMLIFYSTILPERQEYFQKTAIINIRTYTVLMCATSCRQYEEIARGEFNSTKKEGNAMPHYLILSTLTDEGRRTLKQKPERILEVNREIEAMGVKIHKQYALLGQFDFANLVEAPDNETIMKMSVEIGSRGSVQLVTLPALPIEEFVRKVK